MLVRDSRSEPMILDVCELGVITDIVFLELLGRQLNY